MFNRYTKLKRDGNTVSDQAEDTETTQAAALTRKRSERRRRKNNDLANRGTKRVERWMVKELDSGPAIGTIQPKADNVFNYEIRTRCKAEELQTRPGGHTVSPNRYVKELDRVSEMEDFMAKSLRECREPYVIKAGKSPFRARDVEHEINPPIRFKAVTDPERCADTARNQFPAWTDTGDDPTRTAQMGFDSIPVGMVSTAVCVRYKAKAPLAKQFKLTSRPRELNPADSWIPDPYIDQAEPSGYGMQATKYNSRQRDAAKEVSADMYLSGVQGKSGQLAVLGEVSSHRRDRKLKLPQSVAEKSYFGGVKNILTMSGSFTGAGNQDVVANKQLATQVISKRNAAKQQEVSNGSNIYAWNELFGYKDHVNKIDRES